MIDLDGLEKLAKAATPGPWGKIGVPYYEFWIVREDEVEGFSHKHVIASVEADNCIEGSYYVNTQREANAAYIAAANPQAILDLISTNRELVKALKAAQQQLEWAANGGTWRRSHLKTTTLPMIEAALSPTQPKSGDVG